MSQRQLERWHLTGLGEGGRITLKEAGEKLGVSYRLTKRLLRAVRERAKVTCSLKTGPGDELE